MVELHIQELTKYQYRVNITKIPHSLQILRMLRQINHVHEAPMSFSKTAGNSSVTNGKYSIVVTIPLSDSFMGQRVIGRPVCIGHLKDYLVIQYVTKSCKYSRFLLLDLVTKRLLPFEDTVGYFHKDHVLAGSGPLRCLINPGCDMLFIILQARILSSHNWSKLPLARIEDFDSNCVSAESGDEYTMEPRCRVSDVKCERHRTRRNELIAFDPRFDARAVCVLVDETFSRCRMMLVNMNTKKTLLLKRIKSLISPPLFSDDSDPGSDTADMELEFEMESYKLEKCDLKYNCCGNMFVLLVTFQVTSTNCRNAACTLKSFLFVFDADSFTLLKRYQFSVATEQEQPSCCFVSRCDSEVAVCSIHDGTVHIHAMERLPWRFDNLQAICRHTINRHVKQAKLSELPLPEKLIKYIDYDHALIKCP